MFFVDKSILAFIGSPFELFTLFYKQWLQLFPLHHNQFVCKSLPSHYDFYPIAERLHFLGNYHNLSNQLQLEDFLLPSQEAKIPETEPIPLE